MISFKQNWDETLQRFDAWFHNKPCDRPLMHIMVKRSKGLQVPKLPEEPFTSDEDVYTNTDKQFARVMNWYCHDVKPIAEGFPKFSMDLGAGSMALYLGSEPVFTPETVWFKPFMENYDTPLQYDPNNFWWKKHLEILRRQVELTKDTDIVCCIPDIVENIDILSAIRDPQACCFDLYDHPEEVKTAMNEITNLYKVYYNPMYDIVKRKDGASAFTHFDVVGPGKTAKLQCDFAAMMSPEHFNEYVLPTLEDQCSWLDNTIFHLDGPECFQHADAILSIERLGGLQWTPGARNPKAGSECWFPLYKKVKEAEKGLWLMFTDYAPQEAIAMADRVVRKFGHKGFYFVFPVMSESEGEQLMLLAEEWGKCK
ncbi:MAG: hypothetical protein FWE42_01205 [Defluviitaleaceae bacterium]|nr:hypothetical protein [Defluviitaleaceae bacterium]